MPDEKEYKKGKMIMKIPLNQKQVYAGVRDFALKKRNHNKRIQGIIKGEEKVWFEVTINDSKAPKGLKDDKIDAIVEIYEMDEVNDQD